MDKMTEQDGASLDMVAENLKALKTIFPDAFSEDKVDFDALRQLLGNGVDEAEERYGLNWHGKKKARQIALTPSTGTLRPCLEESVDWDTTENLFIEGDNLEVLKLLQKSYANKVKMIYIDPPYNTGKEFIYPDKFQDNLDTYLRYTGQKGEDGMNTSSNTDGSGRYHTNWLNMMYPRLKLAKNLLREDGVIFISIDDNEVASLRKVCDEIFGEENFLVSFSWRTDGNFDNQAKFKKCHEYILGYAKQEPCFAAPPVIDPNVPKTSKLYKEEVRNTIVKNGPKNPVSSVKLPVGFPADVTSGVIEQRSDSWPHYHCDAIIENGKLTNDIEVESGWSSKDLLLSYISNNCEPVVDNKGQKSRFLISTTGAIEVIKKRSGQQSHVISSLQNFGGPQKASAEIQAIDIVFDDYPKPVSLIKYLCQMVKSEENLILDFFAGSSTTAHAVMQLKVEDNCRRNFIMVQLPEPCAESTGAYKAGYKTIAEISKERIRKTASKIKEENPGYDGDLGFKVFKLDSSNIRAWNPDQNDLEGTLYEHTEHLIPGRTEEDILYELLLKRGVDLTAPIEKKEFIGKTVYSIGYGILFACLDPEVTRENVEELASGIVAWHKELEPSGDTQIVFRDSAFKKEGNPDKSDDVAKNDMTEILKQNGIAHVRSL